MSSGYPTNGSVRDASVVWVRDLQGQVVPMFRDEANRLHRLTPTLRPEEVFLRDRTIREFGKREAEELALKIAERTVTPKVPILKAVDLALDAYDIYRFVRQVTVQTGTHTETTTIPGDPDTAPLNWDPTKFNSSYSEGDPGFDDVDNRWYKTDPGYGFAGEAASYSQLEFDNPHIHRVSQRELVAHHFVDYEWAAHFRSYNTGVTERVFCDENHWVKIGQEGASPDVEPETITEEVPDYETIEEPYNVIVPRPEDFFRPRPRWEDLPNQQRHPWDETGNEVPAPIGDPSPQPKPGVEPDPWLDHDPLPDVPPTIEIGEDPAPLPGEETQPQPQPQENPQPGQPRSPPGPRVKERKMRLHNGKGLSLALHVVEEIPELLDAVNALWNILPKSCKTGYYKLHGRGGKTYYKRRFRASQWQRMQDLYRCWAHLDSTAAIKAILANQIEDKVYGALGQVNKETATRLADKGAYHRPVGITAGPWDSTAGNFAGGGPEFLNTKDWVDWFYQGIQTIASGG